MADDDRTRRRLSDATKSRIADLASGWSVDGQPNESAAAPDTDPPRKKQRTIPPPAPGSPERKAFEQTIVAATGEEREDETDVLPPKRPTGAQPIVAAGPDHEDATDQVPRQPPPRSQPVVASRPARGGGEIPTGVQPIVATRPARDDETKETPPPTMVARPEHTDAVRTGVQPIVATRPARDDETKETPPPRIVATTRPREDVTEELHDIESVDASGSRPVGAPQPASPRSTAPSAPPPGRARSITAPPVIGVPDSIPKRPRTSTGQQPVAPRPRAATGQHAIIPTRSQNPSGAPQTGGAQRPTGEHPVVGTPYSPTPVVDARRPTGQTPTVGTQHSTGPAPFVDARRPTGQIPVVSARARRMTGELPGVVTRSHVGTGPHSIVPNRAKGDTGDQAVVPRAPTSESPIVRTRPQNSTGPQTVVPARGRGGTGEQPIVRRSQQMMVPRVSSPSTPPPVPPAVARTKSSSMPPPPPGSPERVAAERSGPSSAPPPFTDRSAPVMVTPLADRSGSGPALPTFGERSRRLSVPPPSADRSKPVAATTPAAPPPPSPKPVVPATFDDLETDPGAVPPAMAKYRAIMAAAAAAPVAEVEPIERSKPASAPPPTAIEVPPLVMSTSALASAATHEPPPAPGPKYPRATNDGPAAPFSTESRTFSSEPRTPAVIVDASLDAEPVKQTVPTGEFDSGVQTVKDKTNPRDAAEALLAIPQAETPVEELLDDDDDDAEPVELDEEDDEESGARQRPLHAAPDPSTEKFERGDPTQDAPPDSPAIARHRVKHPTGGTLRASAQLRRKRGRWGDVRYVSTAIFGVRRSRRELVELEHRQGLRQTSRRRHLITLGRTAAVMDNFDHPALGKSREQLASIEDERSKHAGAVAASDAELERVRRDRDNNASKYALAVSEADAELVELAAKLEPIEKEAVAVRKRAADLREELQRIEKQISNAEASLASPKNDKLDRAAVQADIATYKANKVAVLRDEPIIATELDALNPRIAAMEATRTGLEKKKAELSKAEQEDQRRTLELLEAIGAKRKVVERAAADAEAARDNALFELGERLYVDRSPILTAQLSPIDQIDLEIGEGERRAMELKEILSNVDKAKFARGLAIMILAVGALASLGYLIASAVL